MYLASRSIGFAIQMGKYLCTAMTMMNNLQTQWPKNREGNEIMIKEREKINTVYYYYYYYWITFLNFCLNKLTMNYFHHHLNITT
jgi:hypothetical protein